MMTIGEVAALTELPVATVRYYEKRRLIPEPPRSASGYRQYTPEVVDRLRFVKRAQALGFALEEIGELLDLRVEDGAACEAVEARTRAKLADVRGRIEALRRLEAVLNDLAASCRSRTPTEECPVLDTLSEAGTDA
jgi:Hg(II)-responsive transcriptional regulator